MRLGGFFPNVSGQVGHFFYHWLNSEQAWSEKNHVYIYHQYLSYSSTIILMFFPPDELAFPPELVVKTDP